MIAFYRSRDGLIGAAALVMLLTLAACGGAAATPTPGGDGGGEPAADQGGDQGGGGGGGDLCGVISADEVSELTGGEATQTEDTDTSCSWTIGEGDLVNLRYESEFDEALAVARQICEDEEDVSGIGEEAVWCPGVNVLYFNDEGASLAVQLVFILGDPAQEPREIAIEIARRAAEQL